MTVTVKIKTHLINPWKIIKKSYLHMDTKKLVIITKYILFTNTLKTPKQQLKQENNKKDNHYICAIR